MRKKQGVISCINPKCRRGIIDMPGIQYCPYCSHSLFEKCPACKKHHRPALFCPNNGKNTQEVLEEINKKRDQETQEHERNLTIYRALKDKWTPDRIWMKPWFRTMTLITLPISFSVIFYTIGHVLLVLNHLDGGPDTIEYKIPLLLMSFLFSMIVFLIIANILWCTIPNYFRKKKLKQIGFEGDQKIYEFLDETRREKDISPGELRKFFEKLKPAPGTTQADLLLRAAEPPTSDTLLRPAGHNSSDEETLLRASTPPVN